MDNSGNKRIAKNTAILYVRLIFTMLIGLYTSRLILKNLGVNDFGIYNVVGGVVSMFAVVSSSLSAAISRFLTFKLGQNDINGLRLAFSTSVFIQFLLCLIIVILAEPIGLWFMHNKMTIPLGRIPAAEWVFHFSLATFCLDLINVPYRSLIIAHERMDVYSYLSIFEVAAKLLVVVVLVVAPIDRLVFYSLLLVLVSLVSRIVYGVYCSRSFKECNINFVFDKTFFRQMFSFAGWNFIGAIASVLRDAGGNVVINLFYPPAVNAARGISIQVRSAVCSFSSNFITAINPPITKSFAKGATDYTFSLVFSGAKWSFYLLYMLALPVLINTHYILSIWLGIVPEYTVVFVRLILLLSLVDIISETLITLMLATGNIRNYQIVVGGLVLLNLPLSYMFLKLGFEPQVVFIVSILIGMICIVVRVGMLKLMVELPVKRFLKEVLMKIIIVSFISFSVPFIISFYIEESFGFFVLSCLVCLLSTILGVGLLGMTNNEKEILKSVVRNKIISKIK